MSSLTDIIFLLLIFFMLTSTLVSQNALNLKLPSSNSQTIAPQSLAVSIERSGKYYLNGKQMSFGDVERNLKSMVSGSDNRQNSTISIFAESGTSIDHVVKVMDLALRLNIKAILATDPQN